MLSAFGFNRAPSGAPIVRLAILRANMVTYGPDCGQRENAAVIE
jgi:hypothetical protein